MARLPRFALPGQPQHVIQRGNNRDVIFVTDNDYLFYLDKLKDACIKHQCDIHAYVLMTNHVHLLITPKTESGIGKVMQSLGRHYVQYFNYMYQRTGTLWEGRYKATLIDSENYLLTCSRYIEMNPVRAGMVAKPNEYQWSSYSYNALGVYDEIITPHDLYQRLGKTAAERQKQYRRLFGTKLSDIQLNMLREATNKAWVLGNDRFKSRIAVLINRQSSPKQRGGNRRSSKKQSNT